MARAIQHANRILDWQENMRSDEIPPVWMWAHEDELKIWFEEVDRLRKEKYGGGSETPDVSSGPMTGNELTKQFLTE